MFEATQRSLTRYYVTVTVALFVGMVICFLALLAYVLYEDEKLEALAFAREEAGEYIALCENNAQQAWPMPAEDSGLSKEEERKALRMFALVKLPDGQTRPLTFMTKKIEAWAQEQMKTNNSADPAILSYESQGRAQRRIFFVRQDASKGQVFYGTVYAGKDITLLWSVLEQMLGVSLLLIGCFVALLFYYGSKFAQRAMLPVEEAMRRQKQFITDASHELRTPLSVLLAGTELLKTGGGQESPDEGEKILQALQDEVRRMSGLVEALLNLSKIDEHGLILQKEEDVAKIAALAVAKMRPLAEKKAISLSLSDDGPISWRADNEFLAQILHILLDNAIKYTPHGGQARVKLKIDGAAGGAKLIITVEDTGIGIPEQEQTRIFERFYRVDKARSRKEGGNGLGLSIAKALLDRHGGMVEVKSAPGKGALFKVTLPERKTRQDAGLG